MATILDISTDNVISTFEDRSVSAPFFDFPSLAFLYNYVGVCQLNIYIEKIKSAPICGAQVGGLLFYLDGGRGGGSSLDI